MALTSRAGSGLSQPDNNTTGSGVLLGLFLHLLQIYGGMVFHAEPFLVFVAMWVTQFAYILPAIVVVAALKKWEMLKGLPG